MKSSNSSKDNYLCADKFIEPRAGMGNCECMPLSLKRRSKLPEPVEKEKGVSLWSMIKDNVGKDLTQSLDMLPRMVAPANPSIHCYGKPTKLITLKMESVSSPKRLVIIQWSWHVIVKEKDGNFGR